MLRDLNRYYNIDVFLSKDQKKEKGLRRDYKRNCSDKNGNN